MSSRGMPVTQQMRQERRTRAEARQAEYDKLSLQEKLKRLPAEPAATKQRTRLISLLEKQNQPKAKPEEQKTQTATVEPEAEQAKKPSKTKKYMRESK